MKVQFQDEYLEELAENKSYGKRKYPEEVEEAFKKRIFQIKNVSGDSASSDSCEFRHH